MDAPALRRLLTESGGRAWNNADHLASLVDSVPAARLDASPATTWDEAIDALTRFADVHTGPPGVGTSTVLLARPDAFVDLAPPSMGGAPFQVRITQYDLDHFLYRHTWEHLRFTPPAPVLTQVPRRSLWQPGIMPDTILDDALVALRDPRVVAAIDAQVATGQFAQIAGVNVAGRTYTVGVHTGSGRITQFYPTSEGAVPRRILRAIRAVLGL
jgi:hypothetical protein